MTTNITVKARSEQGRWRAGRHFTRAGVSLAVAELTAEQLAAIQADPELTVIPATGEADQLSGEQARKEAAKANGQAIGREKAATKTKEGKAAWEAAELQARTVSELDEAAWAGLPAADRVSRIEAQLGAGK